MHAMFRTLSTLLCALPAMVFAQDAVVQTDQVRAELVLHAPQGLVAGERAWLGLLMRHQPHWHSYWKNPGDSGMPTSFRWTLPEGVSAGAIEWPTPQRLPLGPLVNYGYEGEVLLPVLLTLAPAFRADVLAVKLRADWLVCKDICIPQQGEFALTVHAGAPSPAKMAHAAAFARARAELPQVLDGATAQARVQDQALVLQAQGLPPSWQGRAVEFFAEDAGVIEHAAVPEQRWDGASLHLRVPLSAQRSESPQPMRAVLVARGERTGVALSVAVQGGWPAPGTAPPGGAPARAAAPAQDAVPAGLQDAWALPALGFVLVALGAGVVWGFRRRSRR
jgi:DsbC/DsbD-like thiol-disulfide interchange protein